MSKLITVALRGRIYRRLADESVWYWQDGLYSPAELDTYPELQWVSSEVRDAKTITELEQALALMENDNDND